MHLQKHSLVLHYPKLDRKTLHIRTYADCSHANNKDPSTQLGFIICLSDAKDNVAIIICRSYKCRRITRSDLASECHALADAFDYSYLVKYDPEKLLQQWIPVQMLTDSKSLFDVIIRASTTSERRLMIDISATKGSLHTIWNSRCRIYSIKIQPCWLHDKNYGSKTIVTNPIHAKVKHPVEQYVIRKSSEKKDWADKKCLWLKKCGVSKCNLQTL